MSDLDTLRWGDTQAIPIPATGLGSVPLYRTKQLVAAKWRRPLAWVAHVSIDGSSLLSTETATITILARFTIGVGGAAIQMVKTYVFAPPYTAVFDSFQLAAQDVQADVVMQSFTPTAATPEALQVGIVVAPLQEPFAMSAILDHLTDAPLGPRWMEGNPALPFDDGQLHYQDQRVLMDRWGEDDPSKRNRW
jgi:hypothetical protein